MLVARALPAALVKYAAGEISSACSCLSIQPKTTITRTATAQTVLVSSSISSIAVISCK
jgi:hypothetical protein